MADEPTAQATESAQGTEQRQTLEDIYSEFNVEPKQQTPPVQSAQPQVAGQAPATESQAGMESPAPGIQDESASIATRQDLENLKRDVLTELQQSRVEREEREVQSVVSELSEKLPGVKPNFIKLALADKYNTDPRFASLWDSRATNKAAMAKALGVVEQEFRDTFAVRQDPQLAENNRAMNDLAKSMGQGKSPEMSENQKAANMGDGEFAQYWHKIVRGHRG